MNERIPKTIIESSKENVEKSMSEAETLSFMKENNIPELKDWAPGMPLLYVLEEATRGDDGPFAALDSNERPSIVRVDSATFLDLDNERGGGVEENRRVYALGNESGGQVDYYAINSDTKQPQLVKTSNTVMTRERPYNVRKETLFSSADDLFPKS